MCRLKEKRRRAEVFLLRSTCRAKQLSQLIEQYERVHPGQTNRRICSCAQSSIKAQILSVFLYLFSFTSAANAMPIGT